jgi:hypothetical protein
MKFTKSYAILSATALFLLGGAAIPARAVTNSGGELPTPYVAAFAPVFGASGVPHSGTMQLVLHDGTISGTYTGTSVGPDYLDNRIVPVSGTVSDDDGHVQLFIGGALSLQGTMTKNGTITGTANYRGRLYEFEAQPGRVPSTSKA